jgi:hypothetical protein
MWSLVHMAQEMGAVLGRRDDLLKAMQFREAQRGKNQQACCSSIPQR